MDDVTSCSIPRCGDPADGVFTPSAEMPDPVGTATPLCQWHALLFADERLEPADTRDWLTPEHRL